MYKKNLGGTKTEEKTSEPLDYYNIVDSLD